MQTLISQYLLQNKYESSYFDEFKENYLSHPNYPTLYAVTDSLELSGIENVTATIPKEQLINLPENFIASLYVENQAEFVLVNKTQTEIFYENQKGKTIKTSFEEFNKTWDGLILAIGENEKPQSQTKISKQNILTILGFVLLVLFGISMWLQPFGLIPFLYQLLSVTGFFTSVFILQEELGNPNSIVSKVCNGTDNTVSCNSVINSKQGKLPLGISFSDLPIVFFGVSFLGMTFNYDFHFLVCLLSMLALPIVFYSIYLQKFVLKKWCVLCLIISTIVILQAILFVFTPKVFDWKTTLVFVSLFVVSFVLWLPLKKTLKQKNTLSTENNELKRFKKNFNIFELLLNKSEVTSTNHLQGIQIGNQNAPVLLELFVSPSCGFCYKAYKECTELLEKQKEKIQLKVYFNLNLDNSDNPYLTVAKNIMQYYQETENTEPLNDWYLNEVPLEKWKQKWEKGNITTETEQIIQEHFEYCTQNNLNYAPVVLVNGKLLPNEYSINELKYFISDLEEKQT